MDCSSITLGEGCRQACIYTLSEKTATPRSLNANLNLRLLPSKAILMVMRVSRLAETALRVDAMLVMTTATCGLTPKVSEEPHE